jgi:DNA ligase (NAD+)
MVEAKIKALRDELERHNYNYYVLSAPTISDFEFDKMMKELQELEAAHPEFADPDSRPGGWGATSRKSLSK